MPMTVVRAVVLTACLAGGTSACIVPFPHVYKQIPEMSGTIRRGDSAVPELPVAIMRGSAERGCADVVEQTRTDATGRFVYGGKTGWVPFWVIPGHSSSSWGLCLGEPGEGQQTWGVWRHQAGPPAAPRAVELECDLGRPYLCSFRVVGETDPGPSYSFRTGPRS